MDGEAFICDDCYIEVQKCEECGEENTDWDIYDVGEGQEKLLCSNCAYVQETSEEE